VQLAELRVDRIEIPKEKRYLGGDALSRRGHGDDGRGATGRRVHAAKPLEQISQRAQGSPRASVASDVG